jgi:uncharacterized coiled-coil protein SlyX
VSTDAAQRIAELEAKLAEREAVIAQLQGEIEKLKREPTKMSVAMKRRKAAWGETYLLDVLSCGFAQV